MNQEPAARLEKAAIRKLGLKNLAACAGWLLVSAYLLLTGQWLEMNRFLQGLAHSLSGGSMPLEPLLGIVASSVGLGILGGWVCFLPSALIMTLLGYYPRRLGKWMFFTPEDAVKTQEKPAE